MKKMKYIILTAVLLILIIAVRFLITINGFHGFELKKLNQYQNVV